MTTASHDEDSTMVTTTTSTTSSSSTRKSETVHRVTFVEHNNTEHGPPSISEDTVITKTESHTVNSDLTDSGYTDSITSHENSVSTDPSGGTGAGLGASGGGGAAGSPSTTTTPPPTKPVIRLTRATR